MPETEKCPFCGSESLFISAGYERRVVCDDCGAMGGISETAKGAIKLWNRRDGEK